MNAAERRIGAWGSPGGGPTLVAIGGLHGNEPAGLVAIRRVLDALARGRFAARGWFVGLRGNVAALAERRRFVARDLNRGWSAESCRAVAVARAGQSAEDGQQRELAAEIDALVARASGPIAFVDLHSTSGRAAPFSVAPDLLENRRLARRLPLPTVIGLEEIIDGTLVGHLCDRGHWGMAVEGGQHEAEHTADQLESVVWLLLAALGIVAEDAVPGRAERIGRLRAATLGLPGLVEIKHRHATTPDDGFQMAPGFANFAKVRRGDRLGHDRRGPIVAPRDGLVMLPRYQPEGDDGFFLARPMTPGWLGVSALARRAQADRMLAMIPGLSRVDARRVHWCSGEPPEPVLTMLHLLGYRGAREVDGGTEYFRRGRG